VAACGVDMEAFGFDILFSEQKFSAYKQFRRSRIKGNLRQFIAQKPKHIEYKQIVGLFATVNKIMILTAIIIIK